MGRNKKKSAANDLNALVCTGGGAIGAYQAGVLKYIYENYSKDGRAPFEIFSGISAGALNATFLACHSAHPDSRISFLEDLWKSFHVPEYHQDLGVSLMRAVMKRLRNWKNEEAWSLFDPSPMYDVIARGFWRDELLRAMRTGTTKGVAIAATELTMSVPVWFVEGELAKTWQAYHSLSVKTEIQREHIAASCSIPMVMPPVTINDLHYIDGSVRLVKPLAAAAEMGARKILCIRTNAEPRPKLPEKGNGIQPGIRLTLQALVNAVIFDHSFTEIEQIRRIECVEDPNGLHSSWKINYDREPPSGRSEVGTAYGSGTIDVFSVFPTRPPRDIFSEFMKMQTLKSTRVRQEFMFHRDFIAMLIEHGYEDAKLRKNALDNFFDVAEADIESGAA